ncbi:hypothetical protein ACFOLF_28275 [Paenibacillus sepulcri]|uniref:DUF4083 domain-containing protein n=1 Tax=Paenibacillus sepulcri TaxID=359917 RepID=A0ABS7CJR6_9BACL|nr:hypothetical protein [Paenibacillus sepulcri]
MVTYASLGLLFLFVVIKALIYRSRVRKAPSPEQLSKLVFSILRSSGQRDRE